MLTCVETAQSFARLPRLFEYAESSWRRASRSWSDATGLREKLMAPGSSTDLLEDGNVCDRCKRLARSTGFMARLENKLASPLGLDGSQTATSPDVESACSR